MYEHIVIIYKDSEIQTIQNAGVCNDSTSELLHIRAGRKDFIIMIREIKRIVLITKEGE